MLIITGLVLLLVMLICLHTVKRNSGKYTSWNNFMFDDVFYSDFAIYATDSKGNYFDGDFSQSWSIFFFNNPESLQLGTLNNQIDVTELNKLRISQVYFVDSPNKFSDLDIIILNILQRPAAKRCIRFTLYGDDVWGHKNGCTCRHAFQNDLFSEKSNLASSHNRMPKSKTIQVFLPPLTSKSGGAVAIRRLLNFISRSGLNLDFRFYGYDSKIKISNLGIPNCSKNLGGSDLPSISLTFDTTTGLPFEFDYGIKWNLNFPGALPNVHLGNKNPGQMKIFNYSSFLGDSSSRLFVNNIDFSFFTTFDSLSKKFNVLYLGKNQNLVDLPQLYKLIDDLDIEHVITRSWPSKKSDLISMLHRTNFFYSFDPLSALNFEASLCGSKVILINKFSPNITKEILLKHDIPMKNIFWEDDEVIGLSKNDLFDYINSTKLLSNELELQDVNKFLTFINSLT